MSFIDVTRSVERQRFFDGQRLLADDLQQIEGFNREMRWLHNQSLHQPGIGNGFIVTGHKGDREVTVGAGYALDDLGREIVLTSSRTLAVPPVAGDPDGQARGFVLTVRYPDDADLEEVELRQGVCGTRGAVRLREEPIFCWVQLNPDGSPARDQAEILTGRTPVLAAIAVRNCRLDKDLSIAPRRDARPPDPTRIACGVEAPTVWQRWDPWADGDGDGDGDGGTVAELGSLYRLAGGIQAVIHTGSGGFLATPGYFARIDGPRAFTVSAGIESTRRIVLEGLPVVVDPRPTSFTVQVPVLVFERARQQEGPVEAVPAADDLDLVTLLADWRVGWMGIEG